MFAGTAAMVMGFYIMGSNASSFYSFILAGILIGVGMSTTIGSPPRYIMLVESPPNERATGQAFINITTSVGQLTGGALIGAIIGSQGGTLAGHESAFMAMTAVSILMLALISGLKSRRQQSETIEAQV